MLIERGDYTGQIGFQTEGATGLFKKKTKKLWIFLDKSPCSQTVYAEPAANNSDKQPIWNTIKTRSCGNAAPQERKRLKSDGLEGFGSLHRGAKCFPPLLLLLDSLVYLLLLPLGTRVSLPYSLSGSCCLRLSLSLSLYTVGFSNDCYLGISCNGGRRSSWETKGVVMTL